MFVGVMPRVFGSHAGFVLAIAGHCCPAELQGHQNQQENCQILFHLSLLYLLTFLNVIRYLFILVQVEVNGEFFATHDASHRLP